MLPQGRLLPEAAWESRHRVIVRLGFLSAFALVLFSWAQGYGQLAAVVVFGATAGPLPWRHPGLQPPDAVRRRHGEPDGGVGLPRAPPGGITESHFIFFVMIGVSRSTRTGSRTGSRCWSSR